MIGSGVLTYAFLVVAARTLDKAAYGRIGVLWGAMFLVAIVLFRPLEQTVSRAIADRLAYGREAGSALRSVSLVGLLMLGVLGLSAALTWNVVSDRLFGGDRWLTAALVLGTGAYGISYIVRGVLAGLRRFGTYGVALLSDSVARLALAVPLLFVASTRVAAAAVTAAGVAAIVAPLLFTRGHVSRGLAGTAGQPFAVLHALRFAGPATVIAAADQLLVNGAPLLVIADRAHGGTEAAGIVFAATMLVRAPVWIFQGFAASLLPNLTHMAASAAPRELRSAVFRTAAWLLMLGAALVGGAAMLGPSAMRLVYGSEYDVSATALALLAAGVTCYLAAGTFSQAMLALGRGVPAAIAWGASAFVFTLGYITAPGSPLDRVAGALLAATLLAACALGGALFHHRR
jgi:O-antigen/teichoic acid export membrane protein